MILPIDKMCPISGGEKPCLGILCAWFNDKAGVCGVVAPPENIQIVTKEAPAKTTKTTKSKTTPKQ